MVSLPRGGGNEMLAYLPKKKDFGGGEWKGDDPEEEEGEVTKGWRAREFGEGRRFRGASWGRAECFFLLGGGVLNKGFRE